MQNDRQPAFTRVYDAPPQLVYEAWTDPAHLAAWWGPKDFANPVCEMEVRPGGSIRIDMQSPDGTVLQMTGIFREVVPLQRLVFSCYARHDERSTPHVEVLNTVIFEAVGDQTRLYLWTEVIRALPPADDSVAGMKTGWSQRLDRLATLASATTV